MPTLNAIEDPPKFADITKHLFNVYIVYFILRVLLLI